MENQIQQKPKKKFYKRWWFWVLAIIVILIIIGSVGSKNTTQQSQNNTPGTATETWQKVKLWSGSGIKNTEPFEITGSQWRINWTNPVQNEVLQVMVYKTGNEIFDSIAVNTLEKGTDSSYIYKKGSFHLSINSTGSWEIEVEELK